MISKLRYLFLVLASFCFVLGMSLPAQAEDVYKVKVAHEDITEAPVHLAFELFKELAEKRSDGRLQITIYPNETLGTNRETIESAQLGAIQMLRTPSGVLAPFVPEMALLDIPFMFNSYDEARTTVESPDLKKFMADACAKKGIVFFGYYEQGFRNITNSKKSIWKLEDLKGLKLRTMEAPLHMTNFKALGASPTPMAWGELFTALQQGVVDGQENPFYVIIDAKFPEVQSYMSITNHIYDAFPNLASKKWWDKLPADLQKILVDCMEESRIYQYSINKGDNDNGLMEILAIPTMKVNAVPPEELAKFKEIGQAAVKEELYKRLGKETVDWWVKRVDEIVAEVRANQL